MSWTRYWSSETYICEDLDNHFGTANTFWTQRALVLTMIPATFKKKKKTYKMFILIHYKMTRSAGPRLHNSRSVLRFLTFSPNAWLSIMKVHKWKHFSSFRKLWFLYFFGKNINTKLFKCTQMWDSRFKIKHLV